MRKLSPSDQLVGMSLHCFSVVSASPATMSETMQAEGKGGRYSQMKELLRDVKGDGKYGLREGAGGKEKEKLKEWLVELKGDIMDEAV